MLYATILESQNVSDTGREVPVHSLHGENDGKIDLFKGFELLTRAQSGPKSRKTAIW